MTAYEKAVIKAFLNEAFGQMAAEVDGQTIIPGYFDTDSSYPEDFVKFSKYFKGKFIELPDDLREKSGIIGVIFFDE